MKFTNNNERLNHEIKNIEKTEKAEKRELGRCRIKVKYHETMITVFKVLEIAIWVLIAIIAIASGSLVNHATGAFIWGNAVYYAIFAFIPFKIFNRCKKKHQNEAAIWYSSIASQTED